MNARMAAVFMKKEVRDARRNRWFLVVSALFATLSVSLSLLGLAGLGTFGVAGFGRTSASLLNLVLLIVPLMGLLLGAMSVVSEKEQGTLGTILAQPVTTADVFWGKYAGVVLAMVATVLVGFGASGMVIAHYAGVEQITDYLVLVAFTVLLGVAFASLGFWISVIAPRHATAVGVSIFLWFLFLFLSDLGIMGSAIVLKLKAEQLFWLVLVNPAQVFKLAVIGNIQHSLEAFGAAGLYASDVLGPWLTPVLSIAMVFWILVPSVAAYFLFRKGCLD